MRNLVFTWRAIGPGIASIGSTVRSADNDGNTSNNVQPGTTTVIEGANLSITKTDTPDPVVGGSNVTYTISGQWRPECCRHDACGRHALAVHELCIGQRYGLDMWALGRRGDLRPRGHAGGGRFSLADHARGHGQRGGGTITNSASVSPGATGGVAEPDSSNNTATANTTVLDGANVRIAQKSVTSATPAIAGSNITFQIQPRNAGPVAAVNARVTDVLPAGWTPVSASGTNWSCGIAGQTVTCDRASFRSARPRT